MNDHDSPQVESERETEVEPVTLGPVSILTRGWPRGLAIEDDPMFPRMPWPY